MASSVINQQDDMGRPVITSDTDNGKTFSTVEGYTPLGDLARETFGSAGNAYVKYDYFPVTGTPSNGSPDALQTMMVTPPTGSPAATNYTYDPNTKQLKTIAVNGVTFTVNYLNQGTGNASTDWVSQVQAGNVTVHLNPDPDEGGRLLSMEADGSGGSSLYRGDYYYTPMDQREEDDVTRTNVADNGAVSTETQSLGYIYSSSHGDALQEVDDNLAGTTLDYYTYDGAGNQTGTSLGTANSLNQYSALTYNSRGDVSGDGTYTYGWDANDQLISVTPSALVTGSVQVKFAYDSQGRWLTKDVYSYSATTSSWMPAYSRHAVWDGENLVAELDQNNVLLKGYTWGPDGLLAVTDYTASGGPKTYAVVSDASGNVVELLDPGTGTVAGSFHYDPWGNLTSSSGPAKSVCPFLGKGLYVHAELPWLKFALQRVMIGQTWMSRDPSGESGGLNVYEAFRNDPINYSDPTGDAPTPDDAGIMTDYMRGLGPAVSENPASLAKPSSRYFVPWLVGRLAFYDSWAMASRAIHFAHSEARSAMSQEAAAAQNPMAKAGFRTIQAGLYGSEALGYFDVTYSQAEMTGLGSAFRGLAAVKAGRSVLAVGVGAFTTAKGLDVGIRSLSPEGRDTLQVGDFVDLGAGLAGSWDLSGGRNGPLNLLNYRPNFAGEVVDGKVTFGANKLLRYVQPSGPSARVTHDLYVRDVVGSDYAVPTRVPTPWSEGNTGVRIFDAGSSRTGILLEGNTTDWGNIDWETFNRKMTQIATDKVLLSNRRVPGIAWFGTKPLPSTGLGGVIASELRAAGIPYYVVETK